MDLQTVGDLVGAWKRRGVDATIFEWPAKWGLTHDMVDDVTNAAKFDLVYPVLMELITGQR